MKYKVFADDELIGESALENGDAPMGVAFGDLAPNENYWRYQSIFVAQNFEEIEKLNLKVKSETGDLLEPCAGIGIEDLSEEAGETCITLTVLGLDGANYEKHFANHVTAYNALFK